MRRATFLSPLLVGEPATWSLVNVDRDTVVAERVEDAFDSEARRLGLLGRDGIAEDRVLVLAPCGSIHTCGMRFEIDALFLAADGRVLKSCARLRPWRVALSPRAFAVAEGAAGLIARSGTQPGDRLALRRR